MKFKAILGAMLLSAFFAAPVMALEKGDMIVRAGWVTVSPKSDNHSVVNVDSGSSLGINLAYMLTPNLSVEVLAAYPFKHDINLNGGGKVASTKHLPPTVSLQYHFMTDKTFKPYVGLGLNYTTFFSTKTTNELEGTKLTLGDSFGLAGEIGADIMLQNNWLLNVSARYMDIDTKAKLDGASLGDVNIDPWVYTFAVGYKF